MGRKTFEFILNKAFLWDRINIIITQQKKVEINNMIREKGWRNVMVAGSLEEALGMLHHPIVDEVFVIGGKSLFEEGIKLKECTSVWQTTVHKEFPCDQHLDLGGYLKDNYTLSEV
jgi:dihydrofolate reductase